MNEQDIQKQLELQQQALAQIYTSVEKTRKYIFWSGIASLILFVAPLIVLAILMPRVLGILSGNLGILSEVSSGVDLDQGRLSESLESLNNLSL